MSRNNVSPAGEEIGLKASEKGQTDGLKSDRLGIKSQGAEEANRKEAFHYQHS